MDIVLKFISLLGLGLTVVPAFMVFAGSIEWRTHATLMMVGALLWFLSAPFWMRGDRL